MANIKFGWTQIKEQTPKIVTTIFSVILYLAAAVVIVVTTFSGIPEHVQLQVVKFSGEMVIAVHLFSTLFGVKPKDPPQVSNTQSDATATKP